VVAIITGIYCNVVSYAENMAIHGLYMPCVWPSPVCRHRAGPVRTYTIMRYTQG